MLKSTAMKLVPKIKHIPIVIVGGEPDFKNLLLAFDGTHGAMKGVIYAGSLIGESDHHMMLYSMIDKDKKFWGNNQPYLSFDNAQTPIDTGSHEIGSQLNDACRRLMTEGIKPDQISIKLHIADRERGYSIVQEARESKCGTVVMGRRNSLPYR